jgi:type II secretory pathway component PulC
MGLYWRNMVAFAPRLTLLTVAVMMAAVGFTSLRASAQPPVVDLVLSGAIVLEDTGGGIACISDRETGRTEIYRVGDTVHGARIVRILEDRVFLRLGEQDLELRLGMSARDPRAIVEDSQARPGPVVIRREEIERLSQRPELSGDAVLLDGGGVRVREVSPAGLLEALGLRPGDVIQEVSGNIPGPRLSLSQAFIQAAAAYPSLRVGIERDGAQDSVYVEMKRDSVPGAGVVTPPVR